MTPFEDFLAAALPPLGLSPTAHRRRLIRRRIVRRMEALGFHEYEAYLSLLGKDGEERSRLAGLLTVTISRFFRNRRVFDVLSCRVLPALAASGRPVAAWSAGCASGEEAFSLRISWEEQAGPKPPLSIMATDIDPSCLARGEAGLHSRGSLREIPPGLPGKYFSPAGDSFRLADEILRSVRFLRHDLLREAPPGIFDLVLCRNAAFTYFGDDARRAVAGRLASALLPGGWLVIGRTETLPAEAQHLFDPAFPAERIFRRRRS